MPYTIFTRSSVTHTSNGIDGPETRHELAPLPGNPVVYQEGNLYLLYDSTGTANNAEIFSAFGKIRQWKEAYIRQQGAIRLEQIAAPYTAAERESWFIQLAEAEAYLTDTTAPVPMIEAMAATRGVSLDIMAGKIMENNGLYRQAVGMILGQQQALIDQAYSTQNAEELINLGWS